MLSQYRGRINQCICQGDLRVVQVFDTVSENNTYLIMCDICGVQWEDPLSYFEGLYVNKGGRYVYVRDAHTQEIRRLGWEKYFYNLLYLISKPRILLGEDIFCFIKLFKKDDITQNLSWYVSTKKKYSEAEDSQIKKWCDKLDQFIRQSDFQGVKELAIQILVDTDHKIIFEQDSTFYYERERLAAELFLQLDTNCLTQVEIGQWAQSTGEKYENSMDPKAKDILIELETMAYMKDLEKSIEELRDLAIALAQSNIKKVVPRKA